MPITVTCSCGKKLTLKDEMAGRKGKCPACGAMIQAPSSQDLGFVEEESRSHLPSGYRECPVCRQSYPSDVVICVQCGIDLETGRSLKEASKRAIFAGGREDESKRPFYSLLLGMITKPGETIQITLHNLGYSDTLIYTIVFFVVSLFIAGFAREGRRGIPEDMYTPISFESDYQVTSGPVIFKLQIYKGTPYPGQKFRCNIQCYGSEEVNSANEIYVCLSTDPKPPSVFNEKDWLQGIERKLPLLRVPMQIREELNKGIVSDELRKYFNNIVNKHTDYEIEESKGPDDSKKGNMPQKSEYELSQNVRVETKQTGMNWILHDDENKRIYFIERERPSLSNYGTDLTISIKAIMVELTSPVEKKKQSYVHIRVGKSGISQTSIPIKINEPELKVGVQKPTFFRDFIISVILNIVALLINVLLINLTSYILQYDTSFIGLTLILMFVSGYVNILKFMLPFLGIFIHDISYLAYIGWLFSLYQTILYIYTLREALGVDTGIAFVIAVLSNFIGGMIAFWLAIGVLSTLF